MVLTRRMLSAGNATSLQNSAPVVTKKTERVITTTTKTKNKSKTTSAKAKISKPPSKIKNTIEALQKYSYDSSDLNHDKDKDTTNYNNPSEEKGKENIETPIKSKKENSPAILSSQYFSPSTRKISRSPIKIELE
eukprot:Pgem_evm1s537